MYKNTSNSTVYFANKKNIKLAHISVHSVIIALQLYMVFITYYIHSTNYKKADTIGFTTWLKFLLACAKLGLLCIDYYDHILCTNLIVFLIHCMWTITPSSCSFYLSNFKFYINRHSSLQFYLWQMFAGKITESIRHIMQCRMQCIFVRKYRLQVKVNWLRL